MAQFGGKAVTAGIRGRGLQPLCQGAGVQAHIHLAVSARREEACDLGTAQGLCSRTKAGQYVGKVVGDILGGANDKIWRDGIAR
ncbi:MAG: hypothetical protein M1830_004162, partial [Pleopsidium flavum]